ncbi:CoA transferase [Actinoplanes sp. NPDC051859]|uniref:CoA transferase n=1 Tax=Actinoplanes sp. NPDC051859 TaxID=3363909 RepID=UPI0037AC0461
MTGLPVDACAAEAVSACLTAAAELAETRTGHRPDVSVDPGHAAAAVRSELLLRDPTGAGVPGFAPLSRLWPAADGWVRTHANYDWHRAALRTALGVSDDAAVGAAIAASTATDIEQRVYAAGGLAVAARTPEQWRAENPPDHTPLINTSVLGPAPTLPAAGDLPASGLRVLDLTRVLAGPVATRMLAALGADVLRVDDPTRPELDSLRVEGIIGKASTLVDGRTPEGRAVLDRLVTQADVVVTAGRPGALDRLGLSPALIAERSPGTVVATLCAWGTAPAWSGRRGFDSLVQIATGIGALTSPDGIRPGALPCQLLDHATGYFLAAGVLNALSARARSGVAAQVSVSLERTARWLMDAEPDAAQLEADAEHYRVPLGGGWTGISPPGSLDGQPLRWPQLPAAYGSAPPAWRFPLPLPNRQRG